MDETRLREIFGDGKIDGAGRFVIEHEGVIYCLRTWREALLKKIEIDRAVDRTTGNPWVDSWCCEIFDIEEDDGGPKFPVFGADICYDPERDLFCYVDPVADIDGSLAARTDEPKEE